MNDPAAVQQKYVAEAQKRARKEGVAQYEVLSQSDSDRLRHLVDDIWADHAALDALPSPIGPDDRPKFLIVGAGIAGLVSAVRLIEQGFSADEIRLVETAGGVGGTWYWNRYPGLHCDVESYIYMPLLEELGVMPSRKYASGVEIRSHLNAIAKKYRLDDKVLFRSHVDKLEWDDAAHLWKVDLTTGRGPRGQEMTSTTVKSDFVILTSGLLAKPQIPKLGGVGLGGFKGDIFHTSLWNYDVTGGSSEETFPDLSKLKDKRVGIIGTGATAIQAVPCLAKYAKELYVFQRTPSGVYSRGQKETDPAEWKTITSQPGWQVARMDNFAGVITKANPPGTLDMVDDEWSKQPAYAALVGDAQNAAVAPEKIPDLIAHYQSLDAENGARLRKRIADIVEDKATAEKLTPWYPAWCKRPTFSDTYLQTFNSPAVHLVDTDGKGVDSVTPEALAAGGTEYPLDVIVMSTGYRAPPLDGGDPALRAGIKVLGRNGVDMTEKFAAQMATLYGVATKGFPNLFWLGPSQAGVEANFQHAIDTQCRLNAYIIAKGHDKVGGKTTNGVVVEVESTAQEAWSMRIMQGAARFASLMVCTPSYINAEVAPGMGPQKSQEEMMNGARRAPWGGGLVTFKRELSRWREEGDLSGIAVSAA
ncbi:Uu.00g041600.m01.CDS01 [Anthostomella pinea]|uniref:Uu.00g041600.m01.CDS01 n=1 Tax=Anthostomella pinea TaxID=933095 RepID=A0AAI8VAX9_9PEZI|nr:Uu.00g041600.m01.CDS01 [Anthostomella pinea]